MADAMCPRKPFSDRYFVRTSTKPTELQLMPNAFWLHEVDLLSLLNIQFHVQTVQVATPVNKLQYVAPHYTLCVDGGNVQYECAPRGRHNMWMSILVLIQHCRLLNSSRLGGISIGRNGLNLSSVVSDL
jgi:hypothetical protein